MITIEHDIYSGRENPSWNLTPAEILDFIETLIADLTVVRPLLSIPAVLGPRGYVISLAGTHATLLGMLGVPTTFRITDLPLDTEYLSIPFGPIFPGDDEAVVDSGQEELPDGNEEGGVGEPQALAAAAVCSLAYTSSSDFSFWNGSRMGNNNCYCYAANYAANHRFATPGKYGGKPLPGGATYASRATKDQFIASMKADGWKTTCNGSSLRIVGYLGKVTWDDGDENWDMHFYRKNLDSNGAVRWCHKPGGGKATNRDYSNHVITNPSNADRHHEFPAQYPYQGVTYNYNQLIGTFYSPTGQRHVMVS